MQLPDCLDMVPSSITLRHWSGSKLHRRNTHWRDWRLGKACFNMSTPVRAVIKFDIVNRTYVHPYLFGGLLKA